MSELESKELRSGTVALVGWTNVGKSTLLNQLVGVKLAAVADVAQTTRTRIVGAFSDPDRGQILFVDTPGMHDPKFRMNRNMVDLTRSSMVGVELVLHLVDASKGIGPGDRAVGRALDDAGCKRVVVLNKADKIKPKQKLLPMIEEAMRTLEVDEVIPVSAESGDNCDALLSLIFSRLPVGAPLYPDDYLTDQPERVLAAEFIREKILHRTWQELPHAVAVQVEKWEEREDGILEIAARVIVERDSHKKIVIGKGGEQIKQVGIAARHELEAFLGKHIFLELWVQVREDWRNSERLLRQLGLG